MFEVVGNIEFRVQNGIVSYARCLETNKHYDFKKANHYYRIYKNHKIQSYFRVIHPDHSINKTGEKNAINPKHRFS